MKLINTITIIFLICLLTGCLSGKGFALKKTQPNKTFIAHKNIKNHHNKTHIGIGKLAGSKIINSTSFKLDKNDKEYIIKTSQQALDTAQTGHTIQWRNPDSGNHGSIKIISDNIIEGSNICRKYVQSAIIEGKELNASGKACHKPGTSWLNSL